MSTREDALSLLGKVLSGACDPQQCDQQMLAMLSGPAADHGVEALLWSSLVEFPRADAVREALTPVVRAAVARDLFVQRDLQHVTATLASAGVPALLLKGAALAYTVYPQPWMRPRIDTDLLVRHGDVPPASRALASMGYVRSDALSTGELVSHQIAFERTDANGVHHVIDLHWKVLNPQIVANALSFDDLWRESQAAPALGPAARVPPAIASLALACVHRLAHHQGNDRLIWLYDIKLLAATLSQADWAALAELACARGIAGFCLDGLRSARASFWSELPSDVEQALATAAEHEPSRVFLERRVSKRDILVSDLKTLASWSARVRLVREHLFPPVAFIQQRYGTRGKWMLPALYAHRLITGASKWGKS